VLDGAFESFEIGDVSASFTDNPDIEFGSCKFSMDCPFGITVAIAQIEPKSHKIEWIANR
jgi:hypothetical protein